MGYLEDVNKMKARDDQADWVMSFVNDSREERADFEEIWDEVERNFLVRPYADMTINTATNYPLQTTLSQITTPTKRELSVLKDPETHQAVMTLVSKIALSLFPIGAAFIGARGVGSEDVHKATTVRKLLEYAFRLPGHFYVMVEWLMNTGIYGTGVLRNNWLYQEEVRNFRSLDIDPTTGLPTSTMTPLMVPVYDDPMFTCVDPRDFFPDPGGTRIDRMLGCAERFKMSASEALRKAEQGIFDMEATREAIRMAAPTDMGEMEDKPSNDQTDLSHRLEPLDDFNQLIGVDYYGEVPFKAERGVDNPTEGIARRVITVLSGVTVRTKVWPRRVPYFENKIMPRPGSFWGISPGEIVRYDQDFADMLKMMLADSVTRMVHPPMLYNKYGDVEVAKLHAFNAGVPIGADLRQGSAIEQVKYDPPVQPGFAMYSGVKQQIREATSALGIIQGHGLGSKRFSATESAATFDQALDRPELFAQVVEREFLPQLGRFTLGLFQEFLPEDDPAELQRRVGQSTIPVQLADILPQYDIEFVGSRTEKNRNQEITAFREIASIGANPAIAPLIPWVPLLQSWFDKLGQQEIAAMVGNPQLIQLHVMLSQLGNPNPASGNNNQTTPANEPAGILPAQALGGVQ